MRRDLVLGAAACSAGAPLLVACSSGPGHDEAARSLRRPIAANTGDRAMLMREVGALRNPGTVKPQHAVLEVPLA